MLQLAKMENVLCHHLTVEAATLQVRSTIPSVPTIPNLMVQESSCPYTSSRLHTQTILDALVSSFYVHTKMVE